MALRITSAFTIPGAVVDAASLQRVDMGGYYQLHSSFDSAASPEKVVAFYRSKLT